MKKVKKVLQNGYKYPQNRSTSFSINFSINFIALLDFVELFTFVFTKLFITTGGGLFLSFTKSFTKSSTKTSFSPLQNGCKYPQFTTGKSFAKSFTKSMTKIVKNYYGAPPPCKMGYRSSLTIGIPH